MKALVRQAKRGDADAFVALIGACKQSMYKVAKAILWSEEDVADAIQDTILIVWDCIGTLKKEEYFKTWLIRILINESNRIYRQRQSCLSDESIPEAISMEHGYQTVEWNIFLETIDEKYRLVLLLHYVEGFKVREIAELLGLSQSNVKKRLSEGRKQ
ncbi:MAG: sigma-70 family RNA polymerase sigma factor, partial [Lachnospiraceae bacterium]|nr:sigma-70 family RNA polymerase sigma factor [Lachnospiraceae bacterium]